MLNFIHVVVELCLANSRYVVEKIHAQVLVLNLEGLAGEYLDMPGEHLPRGA